MNLDFLRQYCNSLPAVTEDIKWGNDLCFCIGGKMFCVTGLDGPFKATIKVPPEEFEELVSREGFEPAPYLARASWVLVTETARLKKKEWEHYVRQSYELIRDKLPKTFRNNLS